MLVPGFTGYFKNMQSSGLDQPNINNSFSIWATKSFKNADFGLNCAKSVFPNFAGGIRNFIYKGCIPV